MKDFQSIKTPLLAKLQRQVLVDPIYYVVNAEHRLIKQLRAVPGVIILHCSSSTHYNLLVFV